MDLQTRKIEFIQEFLKLKSEDAVSRLEKLLKKEQKNDIGESTGPMTEKELNRRIELSEADFENKRFKKSSDLLSKFK
mgnify:CR=1 FL=1